MQKSYLYPFLLIFLFVHFSCTKDNSNYTYTDINTVNIKTNDSIFSLQQLDRLTIKPTLEETKSNTQHIYSYEWLIFPTASTTATLTQSAVQKEVATLLSTNKDLDEVITLPPNAYYLQYNVINNTTGIKSIKRFNVNITAAFHEGWLVTSNTNNQGKISFIRNDDVVFMDPLKESNNIMLKGKGVATFSAVSSRLSEIYAFTNQEIIKLNANDLTLASDQNSLFMEAPQAFAPFFSLSSSSAEQFIIANGKLHATTSPVFGDPSKYSVGIGGESNNLFPFLFHGDRTYISVYDMDKKRFLHMAIFGRALQSFTPNVNNLYDLSNVGKTMVAADIGAQREFYIIMKDDSNQYYYYAYNPSLANPAVSYKLIQNSPEINQAISFASSSSIPHIYYATENKIYLYDILANRSRLLYEFPSNTKIKMLSMLKYKGWGSTNIVDPDFNKRLIVATNTGTQGSVYYFQLDPTGDFTNQTYSKVFTGFGEISHINYRNRNE